MQDPGDGALVLQTLRGDLDAYGEIVRRHQRSVLNVCYRMLADRRDAEDMTQETFLRAYQRLVSFDASRPFGPWIRRVAANLCLNRLQRSEPVLVPIEEDWEKPEARPDAEPERAHDDQERLRALRAALLSLPAASRAVIELRHFHDLSYREIARATGFSISDVKTRLFRARKMLARRMTLDA